MVEAHFVEADVEDPYHGSVVTGSLLIPHYTPLSTPSHAISPPCPLASLHLLYAHINYSSIYASHYYIVRQQTDGH
jgi:hypothetical protein